MRVLFQKVFAVLLIIAVAMAANLHLPLVQAVAWSRMYAQYRESFPAKVALKITFSGEYPCPLCKIVQAAEKERNDVASMMNSTEQVLLLPLPKLAALSADMPPAESVHWFEPVINIPAGMAQPETPPPRLA